MGVGCWVLGVGYGESYSAFEHSIMIDRAAKLISGLTSPFIVIPVFALWIIAHYSRTVSQFAVFSAPFLLLIIALPFCWIYAGVRRGKFTDMHVMMREQRAEPFVVATVGAAALTGVYLLINAPHPILVMAANLAINGVLFGLLSHYWKASMHAASYAAGVLIVSMTIDYRLAALGNLLPLIVWARIRRNRHNVVQALGAAVIVCVTTWGTCCVLGVK
jgi:hypothetical protein